MNESVLQKNWFQRHWKWFVPLLIVLLTIPIVKSSLGGALKDYGTLYTQPLLYKNALTKVKEHKQAFEFLGAPIEIGFLMEGEVQYDNNGNSVKMTIPIKGSKVKARLDIEANRLDDDWVYKLIRVRSKKPVMQIDVLKME